MPLIQKITPTNQTVFNTVEDQYNFQTNDLASVAATNPSFYLSRLLGRLFAGATYTDWVCHGSDVAFRTSSLNTAVAQFDVTPGVMMIDSTLVNIESTDTIGTSPIPADGSYVITVWANYKFPSPPPGFGLVGTPEVVTYSTYIHPLTPSSSTTHTTVSPVAFAGTERILLSIFDATVVGGVYTSVVRKNARYIREVEVHNPVVDTPLENQFTMLGKPYIVRGVTNEYSRLAWDLLHSFENVFIFDIYTYKPFDIYLKYEVAEIFL